MKQDLGLGERARKSYLRLLRAIHNQIEKERKDIEKAGIPNKVIPRESGPNVLKIVWLHTFPTGLDGLPDMELKRLRSRVISFKLDFLGRLIDLIERPALGNHTYENIRWEFSQAVFLRLRCDISLLLNVEGLAQDEWERNSCGGLLRIWEVSLESLYSKEQFWDGGDPINVFTWLKVEKAIELSPSLLLALRDEGSDFLERIKQPPEPTHVVRHQREAGQKPVPAITFPLKVWPDLQMVVCENSGVVKIRTPQFAKHQEYHYQDLRLTKMDWELLCGIACGKGDLRAAMERAMVVGYSLAFPPRDRKRLERLGERIACLAPSLNTPPIQEGKALFKIEREDDSELNKLIKQQKRDMERDRIL